MNINIRKSLNLLNNAFFTDGLLLYVKKWYKCEKPLVIYNVFKGSDKNNFFNQKLIFNLEENSEINRYVKWFETKIAQLKRRDYKKVWA